MGRKEQLEQRNLYAELIAMRDEQRERAKTAIHNVKQRDVAWELNPQGKMQWYCHPALKDIGMNTLLVYVQEIQPGSRSGKQRVQGGQVFYVWQGQGYSEVNGQRHDWEEEDLINLPVLREGCVFQHFATGDKPVLLIAAEPNFTEMIGVDMGVGFEQLEACPEYAGAKRN